jgi:hypothetical protein
MENRNRNLWIILAVVVVLLCCCAVAIAALVATAGAGLFTALPVVQEGGVGRVTERTEQVYPVGQAPTLEVDNFAGDVTVRVGEDGRIRAVVTKKATGSDSLGRIDVDLTQLDNGLRIRTSRPSALTANMSVDIDLFVPADAQLQLDTGAGNVQVDGVTGEISAHTGAGNVEVRGAAAPVNLNTGAGNVDYDGQPGGTCTFSTGAGNISLQLPADLNAQIELNTGIGNISLGGFDVVGDTSGTDVQGTIGTGEGATIEANTGVGNISLTRR